MKIRHSCPTLGNEEREAADSVLRSGHIAQGPEVEAFEKECAAFVGRRHAVAVSSGTAALHLALAAVGVERDEAVGFSTYACPALATAVRLQNAAPVLYDVDEDFNLDISTVDSVVRVVIAAHLFGAFGAAPPVVVDDIAQCFGGAISRNAPVAVTSFYATKLMTTGEGGMLFTDDEGLAEFVSDRRDYDKRSDSIQRFNYKMTDIQAAIGRVQLRRLPGFLARRREIAEQYEDAFRSLPLRIPRLDNHVFFRYVVSSSERDRLEAFLVEHGIEAKRPVHAPAHHALGGAFPRADKAHAENLSLPVYPSLMDNEIGHVITWTRRFFE